VSDAFVADASVAIAWVHPAQATDATQALLKSIRSGAGIHVPALWPLEVANALLVLTRRKRLTEDERRLALGLAPTPVVHHRSRGLNGRIRPPIRDGQ